VNLAPYAPGIFTVAGQGNGQVPFSIPYRLVDSSNPATAGSAIQIFCTGLGPVQNQPASVGRPSTHPQYYRHSHRDNGGSELLCFVFRAGARAVGLYQVNAIVPMESAGVLPSPSRSQSEIRIPTPSRLRCIDVIPYFQYYRNSGSTKSSPTRRPLRRHVAAIGTEPRLRIMRLLLSAHPEGLVAAKFKRNWAFPLPRYRHTWKS